MLNKILVINLTGLILTILSSCRAETKEETLHQCTLTLNYEKTLPYAASDHYDELRYSIPLSSKCRKLLYNSVGSMSFTMQAEAEKSEGALSMIDFGGDRLLSYTVSATGAKRLDSGSVKVEGNYLITPSSKAGIKTWLLPWQQLPEKVYVYFAMPAPAEAFDFPRSVEVTLKSLDY